MEFVANKRAQCDDPISFRFGKDISCLIYFHLWKIHINDVNDQLLNYVIILDMHPIGVFSMRLQTPCEVRKYYQLEKPKKKRPVYSTGNHKLVWFDQDRNNNGWGFFNIDKQDWHHHTNSIRSYQCDDLGWKRIKINQKVYLPTNY